LRVKSPDGGNGVLFFLASLLMVNITARFGGVRFSLS